MLPRVYAISEKVPFMNQTVPSHQRGGGAMFCGNPAAIASHPFGVMWQTLMMGGLFALKLVACCLVKLFVNSICTKATLAPSVQAVACQLSGLVRCFRVEGGNGMVRAA